MSVYHNGKVSNRTYKTASGWPPSDILNFIFVFDDYSDLEDEHGVRAQHDVIMDALRNPDGPRPAGESLLGEMARQ